MARYIRKQDINSHNKSIKKPVKMNRYQPKIKERNIKTYTTAKERSQMVRRELGNKSRSQYGSVGIRDRVPIINRRVKINNGNKTK